MTTREAGADDPAPLTTPPVADPAPLLTRSEDPLC